MKYLLGILAVLFMAFLISFGIDREAARMQYVNRINAGDYEQKIEKCFYSCNCEYYTNLLWMK